MSRENNLDEATIGTQNFDQLEQAGSQWKQAISTKQGTPENEEAFVDMVDKFLVPEMEALGFQSEAAYSIRSKRTLEFATGGERDIEAEIAPTSEGWYVQVYSFQSEEEFDEQQKVPDLRTAVEFIRKVVSPESADGPRAGEDPSQMELPLNEQEEPFPVGSRVTHKAKSSLGVGTVVKVGKSPLERRVEWKESFRKAQTTTEKITMLSDASVKETNMIKALTKSIIKNLQGQGVITLSEERGDPEEEAKALADLKAREKRMADQKAAKKADEAAAIEAIKSAKVSASDIQTQPAGGSDNTVHVLPFPRVGIIGAHSLGTLLAKHHPEIADYIQKNVKPRDHVEGTDSKGKEGSIGGEDMLQGIKWGMNRKDDPEPPPFVPMGKTEDDYPLEENLIKENTNMSNNTKGGFDQRLRNMVGEQIKAALENALLSEEESEEENDEVSIDVDVDVDDGNDEGETIEEKIRSAVRGALAPPPLSLEEKIKNAIRGALLQEEDDKDDDEELSPAQKKLDLDDDGEIEGSDLAGLRDGKEDEDVGEEAEEDGGEEDEKNESLRERIKKSILKTLNEGVDHAAVEKAVDLMKNDPRFSQLMGGHADKLPAAVEATGGDIYGALENILPDFVPGRDLSALATEVGDTPSFEEGYKPTSYNRDEEEDDGFVYATDTKRAESEKNAKDARDAYKPATKEGNRDDEDDDDFVYATDPKTAETDKNAADARRAYKPAGKPRENLSRLAEAGNRELNIRHNKLFETLKKRWIK